MNAPRLADYLEHILAAIDRIAQFTSGFEFEDFAADLRTQDAVVRNLEIIGEASHRIEINFADFAFEHPELPISSAYQMRNAVAHGYFEVDLEVVWRTVKKDLPPLAETVRKLILTI